LKDKKIKNKNYVKKHRNNRCYFKEKNYKAKILTSSIFKSKINKKKYKCKKKNAEKI